MTNLDSKEQLMRRLVTAVALVVSFVAGGLILGGSPAGSDVPTRPSSAVRELQGRVDDLEERLGDCYSCSSGAIGPTVDEVYDRVDDVDGRLSDLYDDLGV